MSAQEMIVKQMQLPAQVTEKIHIGGESALNDAGYITNHNIGMVVDAANVLTAGHYVGGRKDIDIVQIHDFRDSEAWSDIDPALREQESIIQKTITIAKIGINTTAIMAEYLRDNPDKNILVNCAMGINRSAFIIAIYLKLYCDWQPSRIYNALSSANNTRGLPALTNITFRRIIETI